MTEQDPGAQRPFPTLRYDVGYPRTDHPEAGIDPFRTNNSGTTLRATLQRWVTGYTHDPHVPLIPPAVWDRTEARFLAEPEFRPLAEELAAQAGPRQAPPPWTGVRRGRRRWQK